MIKSPQVNDLGDLPSRVGEGAMPQLAGITMGLSTD